MKNPKIILFIFIALCLIQCQGQNKKKDLEMKDTNALESFKKQEHRFEFRENLLFYNDQQVNIGQPLSYIEDVFGKEYNILKDGDVILYRDIPISFNMNNDNQNIVASIGIYLYYVDEQAERKRRGRWLSILDEDYLLIDGVPVNKNSHIEDVNKELIANNKTPFSISMGGHSITRQYIDEKTLSFTHLISYNGGRFTPLSFISYSYSDKN